VIGERWSFFSGSAQKTTPALLVLPGNPLKATRSSGLAFAGASLFFCFAATLGSAAQQMPPAEPPQPMPGTNKDVPTLRITTKEVLVPTLV